MTRQTLLAVVMVSGTLAMLNVGNARAEDLAECEFQAHVSISGGEFRSDGSRSSACAGIVSGALADPGGVFDAQGSRSGQSCSGGLWRGTFEAQVPAAVFLIDPQYAQLSGSFEASGVGQALVISGGGSLDGEAVSFTGIGRFAPDNGARCTGGTLSEHVVLVDEGRAATQQPVAPIQATHHSHRHRRERRHRHRRR